MKIAYHTRQLELIVKRFAELERLYGAQVARLIAMRFAVLDAVDHLGEIPEGSPENCCELAGKSKGKFSVHTAPDSGVRIIFVPDQDPVPHNDDGLINRNEVTDVCILEINDVRKN